MESLSKGMIESAAGSVELALGLIGVMTLFLGLMKVAEAGGLLRVIAALIRPLMVKLFPEVPAHHPAMGAMILNLSANVMGLGNAATPFGIRAMQELNTLNARPGTATDSMALFLAINTSSVTLLPTGVIALRASAGSADPAGILPTTLFATICSCRSHHRKGARFFRRARTERKGRATIRPKNLGALGEDASNIR
jgi:spore maturation protein SpmA